MLKGKTPFQNHALSIQTRLAYVRAVLINNNSSILLECETRCAEFLNFENCHESRNRGITRSRRAYQCRGYRYAHTLVYADRGARRARNCLTWPAGAYAGREKMKHGCQNVI